MHNCKPALTPMVSTEKLSQGGGKLLTAEGGFHYRSTVGALQYLTLTIPDISYSVNKVCQFLQTPTDTH